MTETTGHHHTVSSICCYCGTGCGVEISTDGSRVLAVTGDGAHPANFGRLCSKGRTLGDTTGRPSARLLRPTLRLAKDEPAQEVSWDSALEAVSGKLADAIRQHGPDAVGFYLSGQLLTEDYYLFNKLARGLVGTNNVDTNSRLCMSSAVTGYKLTLGADAPPACYDDFDHAECVLIAGSNMAFAHPVLFRRLEDAKAANPAMKIIVVDPRRTDTASIADLYLPVLPGTDVALFHGMLNVMIWEELIDRDYIAQHTEGFAVLKQRLQEFTPRAAAELCGISEQDLVTAARWFAQSAATLSCYTMGLNQYSNGSDKNAALIHLHLATGHIGRPGCGPFSLTGQPNAMGGREVGGLATALPGHREPGNAAHRAEVAALWNVPALPATPGLAAVELFEAAAAGKIKVLWIVCTNPAQSMPEQALVRAALEQVDCVIVQEAFNSSETLAYADIVLPAATWPEKDGTVTNSERRISRVRAALPAPGQAREDWRIADDVAQRLAASLAPERLPAFGFVDAAAVFAEHATTTAGRDLDYSALSYEVLEQRGPQQWPFRDGHGTARLYGDGVFATANGRAQFVDVAWRTVSDKVSAHFPLRLTTGRLRDHWHTMSRTALVPTLTRHVEEPQLAMHPRDLQRQRLASGDLVKVRNKRGAIYLPVVADDKLRPGVAFIPMHWGGAALGGQGINALTTRVGDPLSRQPELKHAAVAVEAAKLPWRATLLLKGDALAARARLDAVRALFPYAVAVPVMLGGVEALRLRLAASEAPDVAVLQQLASVLEPAGSLSAALDDPARGILRRVWLQAKQPLGFVLAGDVRADEALSSWLDGGAAPDSLSALLTGQARGAVRSRVVCSCEGVREDAICAGIAKGLDVDGLKRELRCGTGCGSCVPELVRMVAA
ncbi:nitrate reductase [Vogesella indigofera]|uniref:nitrate reductase n=1 Tax=Vogesella indigofera TaxID=45465 RepID=UPI00234E7DDF|nr:nitrate reductase [Vogesella indigofera]MDC7700395.1 molybdopterin-dependent oxidoreductase [Vogesella indigofera]